MSAQVAETARPEEGIGDGVRHDIAVRSGMDPSLGISNDTSQQERRWAAQPMRIETPANSHELPPTA